MSNSISRRQPIARRLVGLTIIAAVALFFGCAEGDTAKGKSSGLDGGQDAAPDLDTEPNLDTGPGPDSGGPDVTDTGPVDSGPDTNGSDDATDADAGQAGLVVCVLGDDGPGGDCADPAVLDFGVVGIGESVELLFRVENHRDVDVRFTDVQVDAPDFEITTVVYVEDSNAPGTFQRHEGNLPLARSPGAAVYFEVVYNGGDQAGDLPADEVRVYHETDADDPIIVPIVGEQTGCDAGTANCDGDPSTGCETDLDSSMEHCGSCGTSCEVSNSQMACNAGSCEVISCDGDFANCDGDASTGCEVDTSSNDDNCGSCGETCDAPDSDTVCSDSSCEIVSCDAGFADCNDDPSDGCEVDIGSDADNCGGCGQVCEPTNAKGMCAAGSCEVDTCDPGFADCDGDAANGCEVDLATDPNHCGSCNNICDLSGAAEACVSSQCTIASCDPGYGDCDGDDASGCETNVHDDPTNCGSCGNSCDLAHASETCSGGNCAIDACDSGYGDCDSDPSTGCEASLTTLTNCGSCGASCSLDNAYQTCSTGSCEITDCHSKYCNLNGLTSDGCEYSLDNNPSCSSSSYLGSINGDTGGGSSSVTVSGRGERWYYVRVYEDSNWTNSLSVRGTLTSPSGTDYDLKAYCAGCSGLYDGSLTTGLDSAGFWWGDSWGSDDTTYIYFKVETFSANICDTWTLTIQGDVSTSGLREC
jgi:hypothetical protein